MSTDSCKQTEWNKADDKALITTRKSFRLAEINLSAARVSLVSALKKHVQMRNKHKEHDYRHLTNHNKEMEVIDSWAANKNAASLYLTLPEGKHRTKTCFTTASFIQVCNLVVIDITAIVLRKYYQITTILLYIFIKVKLISVVHKHGKQSMCY